MAFTNLIENSIFAKKTTANVATLKTSNDDFDVVQAYYESMVAIEDEFYEINRAHLQGTHLALKEGNMEILQETMGDAMKSIIKFFNNLLNKFKEFMKKVFMMISAYLGDFEKFLTKYKGELEKLNPDFTIRGYTYSFISALPKTDKIQGLVNSYNNELNDIDKLNKTKILAERQEFMTDKNLDNIRAYVIGASSGVKQEDFSKELKKGFRSKQEEEKDIHVDKAYLNRVIADYPEMKKLYSETSKQRDEVTLLIENIKNFFTKSASVYYNGSDKTMAVKKFETQDGGSINTTDKIERNYDQTKLETINTFFNFKYVQAKELGNMCVNAMIEKTNAIKECLKLYRVIIRHSLTSKQATTESAEIILEFSPNMDEIKSRRLTDGFIDSSNEFEKQTEIFHNVKKLLNKGASTIADKQASLKSNILTKKDYDMYKEVKEALQKHVTDFNDAGKKNNSAYRTGLLVFDNKVLVVVYNDKENTVSKVYLVFRRLSPNEGQQPVTFDVILEEKK